MLAEVNNEPEVQFASYQLEDGSFATPSELGFDTVGASLICPYCGSKNTSYCCSYQNWVCNRCDVIFSLEDTGWTPPETTAWELFLTPHGSVEFNCGGKL